MHAGLREIFTKQALYFILYFDTAGWKAKKHPLGKHTLFGHMDKKKLCLTNAARKNSRKSTLINI